jgi:hypothetical protein
LFQEHEREYKIQLGNALARSRELLKSDRSQALRALDEAIKSKDDNIIYWEDRHAFRNWLANEPSKALGNLDTLWNDSNRLDERFRGFANALTEAGLNKSGAQLAIISTLLMAFSAKEFPPVKVDSFSRAMKLAGWAGLYRIRDPFERYTAARSFMDEIRVECSHFGVELKDRLDVQGVVWCVSGGWPKIPVPADWINDPDQRLEAEQSAYTKEFKDLEDEPGGDRLTPTEKLTLCRARLGQGKFREDVLKYWDCCCLTQCSHLSVLRASHIKPWKGSTNKERLDPFNGLLLSPNLDSAFDKGLITFEDSGKIKISPQLTMNDRVALGIHAKMRLPQVSPRHLTYLKYHREKVFVHK